MDTWLPEISVTKLTCVKPQMWPVIIVEKNWAIFLGAALVEASFLTDLDSDHIYIKFVIQS